MDGLEKECEYEMIRRASAGNAEAKKLLWVHLYADLPPLISRVASTRGVARQDLNDAVHEVVCRIMQNIEQLRAPERFGMYIFRIMQHVARMFRPQRHFEQFNELVMPGACEDRDLSLDIAKVLSELPARVARTVVLVYLEGHSYEEAAVVLGCSTRSIKRTLQNARVRMRVLLKSPRERRLYLRKSLHPEDQFPFAA